ncbi:hypothetical protein GCM10012289_04070 [Nonomuraea cavernae]|uniref:Uncharacterized protein n=1 Tax=Nonomuraea cavernae TaxID=2045107 RepID=A0A918DF29_9ACTN|nr:hypothetical protein GCM10012289_04070 [Nonomuraea cavernae]
MAEVHRRRALRADGLHDEAVHGPDVRVALPSELGVELVDEAPEGQKETEWQLEARGGA